MTQQVEIKRGTWRQRLRNPSVPLVVAVFLLALLAFGIAFGPCIQRRGAQGLGEVRKLAPSAFQDPPETWIRPWLIVRIDRMRGATAANEWYPTDFVHEACAESWVSILPTQKYQDAVRSTCTDMRRIQDEYAYACTATGCALPPQAIEEIDGVERRLNKAYEGAFTPVAGPTIRLNDEP